MSVYAGINRVYCMHQMFTFCFLLTLFSIFRIIFLSDENQWDKEIDKLKCVKRSTLFS